MIKHAARSLDTTKVIGNPTREPINLQSSRVIKPCSWYSRPIEDEVEVEDINKIKKQLLDQTSRSERQAKLIEKLKFKACVQKFEHDKTIELLKVAVGKVEILENEIICLTKDNRALKNLIGL
jgi:hypothetical protein